MKGFTMLPYLKESPENLLEGDCLNKDLLNKSSRLGPKIENL